MSKTSKIEWTHHTFNPWWGCTKVSAACKNCYAESWAVRLGAVLWGAKSSRRFFNDKHWDEPLRWNRQAERQNERHRVFCASMADVFENRRELKPWRERLWKLIGNTPQLDWLLLTKRPQLVGEFVPWGTRWPRNVWLGTTIETQLWAEKRLPILLDYPASVHFLSCEPLLGPLDLRTWLLKEKERYPIGWVIAGGESGSHARPMHPEWAANLRDQCIAANVPFHFKQWGHWCPEPAANTVRRVKFLTSTSGNSTRMVALGKKAAGRSLDGRTWDEIPYANSSLVKPDTVQYG